MKLIVQPNSWSCGIASLAMLFDVPIETVIEELGHDGSEIVFPELEEPHCRRAFHIQEFLDFAYRRGYTFALVEAQPQIIPYGDAEPYPLQLDFEFRIFTYMKNQPGLIIGMYALDQPHMVAWDGSRIYDPSSRRPRSYEFVGDSEEITIIAFLALYKIKS